MKKIRYTLLFLLSLTILAACSNKNKTQAQERLDAKGFKEAVSKASVQLVDVRTPNEYNSGHIKGAKLINYYDNSFRTQVAKLDKNKPVYLYCAGGVRSSKAAGVCKQMGFEKVYDMQGGVNAWLGSGFEVVK